MFPVKVTFALLSPMPFLEVGSRLVRASGSQQIADDFHEDKGMGH